SSRESSRIYEPPPGYSHSQGRGRIPGGGAVVRGALSGTGRGVSRSRRTSPRRHLRESISVPCSSQRYPPSAPGAISLRCLFQGKTWTDQGHRDHAPVAQSEALADTALNYSSFANPNRLFTPHHTFRNF